MSSALPLLGCDALHTTMWWHEGRAVTRAEFLARAITLAARLPTARYAINLCKNRYAFSIAFAAACLRGQTNLLPASVASGALQAVCGEYPNHHLLDEVDVDLSTDISPWSDASPSIPSDHIAAVAFTSGSTGKPQAHASTWATLVASARRSAARIFQTPNLNLVATVPAQHMFGLEMSVLQPLVNGCAAHSGRPFFPADVIATLALVPGPRALVTTPAHLRACVASSHVPQLEFVLSATAPLARELAQQVETAWQTPVLEIYGSTETGAIASRRTVNGDVWELLPGGAFALKNDTLHYIPVDATTPIVLHDQFERIDDTRFILAGRSNDLIKVAGKRASLADLNARLLAIPGVRDGVVFQPEPDGRVAALAVVDGASEREILAALSLNLDEVFVPRPLRIVPALPRDAMGKLPRERLLAALHAPPGDSLHG